MEQALPRFILIPHLLHVLTSNIWSLVSEHPNLVHSMEPCISVPGAQGALKEKWEGRESS